MCVSPAQQTKYDREPKLGTCSFVSNGAVDSNDDHILSFQISGTQLDNKIHFLDPGSFLVAGSMW